MSEKRWIVIPRWDEFQHRDMARTTIPSWIKNMTRLLHDDNYLDLTLSQRGVLHGLWLLYASHRRVLCETDARRMLVGSDAEARYWRGHLEALNHAGFIEFSASKPARHERKPASLEVEVEVEVKSKDLNPSPSYESRHPHTRTDHGPNGHTNLDIAATVLESLTTATATLTRDPDDNIDFGRGED